MSDHDNTMSWRTTAAGATRLGNTARISEQPIVSCEILTEHRQTPKPAVLQVTAGANDTCASFPVANIVYTKLQNATYPAPTWEPSQHCTHALVVLPSGQQCLLLQLLSHCAL